ncbi:MAG: hypothetical protein ACLQOO_33090 [Terriglobia bacterium]
MPAGPKLEIVHRIADDWHPKPLRAISISWWTSCWSAASGPSTARSRKGAIHLAVGDVKPDHRFLVNPGRERYPIAAGLDAIGLAEMAAMLAGL